MTTAYKRRHHGRFRLFVAFAQQYRGYHRIPAGYPVPQADALNMKVVRKGSFLRIAPSWKLFKNPCYQAGWNKNVPFSFS